MTQAQSTARKRLDDLLANREKTSRYLAAETVNTLRKLSVRAKAPTRLITLSEQEAIEICYEMVFAPKAARQTLKRAFQIPQSLSLLIIVSLT